MRTCWVILLLAAPLSRVAAADAVPSDAESQSRLVRTALVKAHSQLPLSFEENRGQAGSRVKFLHRGSGCALLPLPDEAVLAVPGISGSAASKGADLRMRLVGANALATAKRLGPTARQEQLTCQ